MFASLFLLDRSCLFSCDCLFQASRFKLTLQSYAHIWWLYWNVSCPSASSNLLPWTYWSKRACNNFGNAVVMSQMYSMPPSEGEQSCISGCTKLVERKFGVQPAFSIFVWNRGRKTVITFGDSTMHPVRICIFGSVSENANLPWKNSRSLKNPWRKKGGACANSFNRLGISHCFAACLEIWSLRLLFSFVYFLVRCRIVFSLCWLVARPSHHLHIQNSASCSLTLLLAFASALFYFLFFTLRTVVTLCACFFFLDKLSFVLYNPWQLNYVRFHEINN